MRSSVPALPVMHIKRGVTVLEPMSDVSVRRKAQVRLTLLLDSRCGSWSSADQVSVASCSSSSQPSRRPKPRLCQHLLRPSQSTSSAPWVTTMTRRLR